MSSPTNRDFHTSRAEAAFRDAFERLKRNSPTVLPKGTQLSQNNVAKEAGCDPSALRKSRYPELIREIQLWVLEQAPQSPRSKRQLDQAQRARNRSLREKLNDIRAQRDRTASMLVEADAKILELTLENARLHALLETERVNVTPIKKR